MRRFAILLALCVGVVAQADYLGSFRIGDYLFESVTLHQFSSGAAMDATGDVHMHVYENGNPVQIIDDNDLTKFDSLTGFYGSLTQLKAATGFELGKMYTCEITATVDGVTGIHRDVFQMGAAADVNSIYLNPVPNSADLRAQLRYQLAATIVPADANVNSMAEALWFLSHALIAQPGTTVAVVTDASTFTLTAGNGSDDWYNGSMIVVEDVSDSNRRSSRFVRDYTGASKTVKTDEAFPFLPAAGDPVYIYNARAVGRGRVSP
jgi:hypothetical protein